MPRAKNQEPKTHTGSGHAKLILFGEHAVVYGQPAVAAGLPRGARAVARAAKGETSTITLRDAHGEELAKNVEPDIDADEALAASFHAILSHFSAGSQPVDVEVDLEVPVGVGLGSSAALAVAVARSLGAFFDTPDAVEPAARASEEVFHGSPSGIDQMAATEGGLFFFLRGDRAESAPIEAPPMTLAVCQAGPAASTSKMVNGVADLKRRRSALVSHINQLIGDTARAATEALRHGDWEAVGEMMNINHGALVSLGVSTAELDLACHTARGAGALGAKLTGAGGGGCVFALTPDGAGSVLDAWREQGWQGFEVVIGH